MRKNKDGFISNPTLTIFMLILGSLDFIILIWMIIYQILNRDNDIIIIILISILLLLFLLIPLFIIKKFTYRLKFDEEYLYQTKGKKLVNKLYLNSITMKFVSAKLGTVNIYGLNAANEDIILCFEFSKRRAEIIKKYYKKEIIDLPVRLKNK